MVQPAFQHQLRIVLRVHMCWTRFAAGSAALPSNACRNARRTPEIADVASRSRPGCSSCICTLSRGSKPVNGLGRRSPRRDAPRNVRTMRMRYAACSENLLRLIKVARPPAAAPPSTEASHGGGDATSGVWHTSLQVHRPVRRTHRPPRGSPPATRRPGGKARHPPAQVARASAGHVHPAKRGRCAIQPKNASRPALLSSDRKAQGTRPGRPADAVVERVHSEPIGRRGRSTGRCRRAALVRRADVERTLAEHAPRSSPDRPPTAPIMRGKLQQQRQDPRMATAASDEPADHHDQHPRAEARPPLAVLVLDRADLGRRADEERHAGQAPRASAPGSRGSRTGVPDTG